MTERWLDIVAPLAGSAGGGDDRAPDILRALSQQSVFSGHRLLRPASTAWPDQVAAVTTTSSPPQVEEDNAWLFFLPPAETIAPDFADAVGPLLDAYDAIWGAVEVIDTAAVASTAKPAKKYLHSCHENLVGALSIALYHWISPGFLVRKSTFSTTCQDGAPARSGCFAEPFWALWSDHRSVKISRGLTQILNPLRQPVGLDDDVRARLVAMCSERRPMIEVSERSAPIKLAFTGRNPTLERTQLRGVFYERDELRAIAAALPDPGTVVDIGANTGNHTAFFAGIMRARSVVPIEPNPNAYEALRAMVAANGFDNVDFSWLGHGIGATTGRAHLSTGQRGILGTGRLVPDTASNTGADIDAGDGIPVLPLDDIPLGPIDLIKIDVEDGELGVLEGAKQTILRDRPLLFVEVTDQNLSRFTDTMDRLDYEIAAAFADEGYANYLARPRRNG